MNAILGLRYPNRNESKHEVKPPLGLRLQGHEIQASVLVFGFLVHHGRVTTTGDDREVNERHLQAREVKASSVLDMSDCYSCRICRFRGWCPEHFLLKPGCFSGRGQVVSYHGLSSTNRERVLEPIPFTVNSD